MEKTANKENKRVAKNAKSLDVISKRAEALEHQIAELSTTSTELTVWQSEFTEMHGTQVQEFFNEQVKREEKFEAQMLDWNQKSEADRTAIMADQMTELQAETAKFKKTCTAAALLHGPSIELSLPLPIILVTRQRRIRDARARSFC